ncbi:MAG: hypothetical protein QM733_04405 [Ilumatobacteraceae bacterium]
MTIPPTTPTVTRPATIHVYADLRDGVHATDSADFVHWWLPTLGPTATLLARQLAASVAASGEHTWQCDQLARLLGLGGSSSSLWRAIERLVSFGVVVFASVDVLTVRATMPALRAAQLARHPHAADYPTADALAAAR